MAVGEPKKPRRFRSHTPPVSCPLLAAMCEKQTLTAKQARGGSGPDIECKADMQQPMW